MSKVQLIQNLDPEQCYVLYNAHGSMTKVLTSFGISNDPRCRKLLSAKIKEHTGNDIHSQKHARKHFKCIEQIRELIPHVTNMTELLSLLKIQPTGGNYANMKTFLAQHNIRIPRRNKTKWADEQVYCCPSKYPRSYLSNRVKKDNWMRYQCHDCGLTSQWNEKNLKLQLDHVSGQSNDNRKCNLRWLCPNCHSQTPTFAGKLSGAKKAKYAAVHNALDYLSHTGDSDQQELNEFLKTGNLSNKIQLGAATNLDLTSAEQARMGNAIVLAAVSVYKMIHGDILTIE